MRIHLSSARRLSAAMLLCAVTVGGVSAGAARAAHLRQGDGPMDYAGGKTMHNVSAYAIFWLPDGQHYQPAGAQATDDNFILDVKQFMDDLGGSDYYNILTQYGDKKGPVKNRFAFGGGVIDSSPYPHAGTRADPLRESNLVSEIKRVIKLRKLKFNNDNTLFMIFTADGIQSCAGDNTFCTFNSTQGYCAYHSNFSFKKKQIVFAVQPTMNTQNCQANDPTTDDNSPNNDAAADRAIDLLAHEIFESVTDPVDGKGWSANGDLSREIGDLCDQTYGPRDDNGGDVVLNGHEYYVQSMYSNKDGGCVMALGGDVLQPAGS